MTQTHLRAATALAGHSIFTHPFGRSRPVYEAPNDGGTATPPATPPAATPPATDPVAELVASVAALRAELAEMKAKPAPTLAPVVPPTDQGKPTITPVISDFTTLPPIARIAAGYRK